MNTLDHSLRIGSPRAVHPYARAIAGLVLRIADGVRGRFVAARQAREARAQLLGMSDRDLRDIGLTRFELHRLNDDGRL